MKLKLLHKLRKLNYINYIHKYFFAKCALMTHSDQIEMYLLQQNRLQYILFVFMLKSTKL